MVDFLICKNCGNYIGAVQQADGQLFGIMNANLTEEQRHPVRRSQRMPPMSKKQAKNAPARRKEVWTPATLKVDGDIPRQ